VQKFFSHIYKFSLEICLLFLLKTLILYKKNYYKKIMQVKRIEILGKLENILDDNVDVAVELDNGHTYVVVVATQKNLLTLMTNEKSNFLSPGDPMIVVKELTKEVVEKAIEAYAEDDAYYLKFYAAE
jgi:hypothetical protein